MKMAIETTLDTLPAEYDRLALREEKNIRTFPTTIIVGKFLWFTRRSAETERSAIRVRGSFRGTG